MSLVYHAQLDKTGMQPQDHADVHSVQTGMEFHVSAVSEEDNGVLKLNNVSAHQETGTDSHAFHVPLDNNGTQLITLVHAQPTLSGTVLTAELAQETTDIGTIKLTIVFAELETGTELNVSSAQPTPIGTERPVSLVMEEDCGTHLIWSVNVPMILNGTVSHVLRHVLMVKPSLMVFAFAHKVNSNKMENVSTTQLVKPVFLGMENNVLVSHVSVALHTALDATVVKPQSSLAQQVPIGMVTDVFMSPTSVQLV